MTAWLITHFPDGVPGLILFWTVTAVLFYAWVFGAWLKGGRKWRGRGR